MNTSNFDLGALYQTISENVWLLFETPERAAQAILTYFSNPNIAANMMHKATDINFKTHGYTTNTSIKPLYPNNTFVVLNHLNNNILKILTSEGEVKYMVVNHPQYSHIHLTKL